MSMEVFLCAFASLVVYTYLCMYVYVNMHVCRCRRAYIHTYICIYLRVLHFACFICFMSPCVGMGRDKWTITWLSFTHVNILQVCTVQKTEKVIYSRTITQGLNFTRSLFSVLLFIYILSQVTDIFLLMIANVYLYVCIFICCMATVILLYWLILWFANRSELTSIKGSINLLNLIHKFDLLYTHQYSFQKKNR